MIIVIALDMDKSQQCSGEIVSLMFVQDPALFTGLFTTESQKSECPHHHHHPPTQGQLTLWLKDVQVDFQLTVGWGRHVYPIITHSTHWLCPTGHSDHDPPAPTTTTTLLTTNIHHHLHPRQYLINPFIIISVRLPGPSNKLVTNDKYHKWWRWKNDKCIIKPAIIHCCHKKLIDLMSSCL